MTDMLAHPEAAVPELPPTDGVEATDGRFFDGHGAPSDADREALDTAIEAQEARRIISSLFYSSDAVANAENDARYRRGLDDFVRHHDTDDARFYQQYEGWLAAIIRYDRLHRQ